MVYQNPDDAASNINVLIDYLRSFENSSKKYIYRGQVKDWNLPLIPSLYRRSIRLQHTFTNKSKEYGQYSLRKCGRQFVEMKPDSYIEKIVLDAKKQGYQITRDEYSTLLTLSNDVEFSRLISTEGFESALKKRIRPETMKYVLDRKKLWQSIIDELSKGGIRHDGFVQPFGYVLGMTLAQQYGFSSELLDFTSSIEVAAFFSTHDGPHYNFEGSNISKRTSNQLGVIYRLPSSHSNVAYERIDHYNYYTCPAQLHMSDLCKRFEDKSSPEMSAQWMNQLSPELMGAASNGGIISPYFESQLMDMDMKKRNYSVQERVDNYLKLYYDENIRFYRLLDLPTGSFEQSRLGRQKCVVIVPDELRQTHQDDADQDYVKFQCMEDVSKRDGFERFYFKHTDTFPDIGKLNREYLWPEEDTFKLIISRVLSPLTPIYYFMDRPVLKRIDFVSRGFLT